ncbi:hypothetical protein TNCV_4072831 [Trichonephila clavipes]|uniref:Uncharacterized protein n=1 Tax=Trichonephila clavipes TaxID=2585209 RepID=A0A8X7BG17_TRICX|nr:hypothetical protein TNCV_4072831 [Trichonephila clavipes]
MKKQTSVLMVFITNFTESVTEKLATVGGQEQQRNQIQHRQLSVSITFNGNNKRLRGSHQGRLTYVRNAAFEVGKKIRFGFYTLSGSSCRHWSTKRDGVSSRDLRGSPVWSRVRLQRKFRSLITYF